MHGNSWAAEAAQIRRAIEALGRRRRTERIPLAIRGRVVRVIERGRARGMSWRQLAEAVGLAVTTIERWWALTQRPTRALVPVRIEPAPLALPAGAGLVVVSPRGVRLEGLTVAEAIAVLQALG